jgi:NAD(P)-dependent dehydrogenase (short-subunit alcohol dehydrogenase family)
VDTISLDGAVSFVTGAGGGIGESIARELAARGGVVVVADIEKDAADRVAQDILSHGGQAETMQVDVGDAQAVQAVADEVFVRRGRVDVLVNNAGVSMRPLRAVWDASVTDFEWMMRINYFGVVNGIRSFLPRMRAQGTRGHIVNTSSFVTLNETPGHGMYAASKAAVDGISEVLRAELEDLGDPIGVTVLYPGQVTTRIATSERLRDAPDRSEARGVKPYEQVRPMAAYQRPSSPSSSAQWSSRRSSTTARTASPTPRRWRLSSAAYVITQRAPTTSASLTLHMDFVDDVILHRSTEP